MDEKLRQHYLAQAYERAEHERIHHMLNNHDRQSGIVALWLIAFYIVLGIATVIFIYPYVMAVVHFIQGIFS